MEELLLEKLLEAHRLLRHDVINYLQVISGYQQIGHPEKTTEYMTKAIDLLHNYSIVSKVELLLLQSLLIWCMARYNTDFEVITVQVDKSFTAWKDKDRELTSLIMRILYILQDKFKYQEALCRISFKQEPETAIEMILNGKEGTFTYDLMEIYSNIDSEVFTVNVVEKRHDRIQLKISAI